MVTDGLLKEILDTNSGKRIRGSEQLGELMDSLRVQSQSGEKMGNGVVTRSARGKILTNNRLESKHNIHVDPAARHTTALASSID